LKEVFLETFKSESKTLEFIQTRLRSATDIYKYGGHVTMVYRDQLFRMHFDNKRILLDEGKDLSKEILLDSNPLNSVSQGENLRFISKLPKLKQYTRFSNLVVNNAARYKSVEDLAVINFVKGLLISPPMFNLHRVGLEEYKDIVAYLKAYNPKIKLNEKGIAVLKSRPISIKTVPRVKQTEDFVNFLLLKFKNFDTEAFFRKY
jgi:hypothetical protein